MTRPLSSRGAFSAPPRRRRFRAKAAHRILAVKTFWIHIDPVRRDIDRIIFARPRDASLHNGAGATFWFFSPLLYCFSSRSERIRFWLNEPKALTGRCGPTSQIVSVPSWIGPAEREVVTSVFAGPRPLHPRLYAMGSGRVREHHDGSASDWACFDIDQSNGQPTIVK